MGRLLLVLLLLGQGLQFAGHAREVTGGRTRAASAFTGNPCGIGDVGDAACDVVGALGGFEYAAMDEMLKALKIVGALKAEVDWKKMVDTSFLPQELQNSH